MRKKEKTRRLCDPREAWPTRWASVDGVPCLAHRFVEDHTTVALCGVTHHQAPIKVLCEYEDGSLKLVPIDKVEFHPSFFYEEFQFLKFVIYEGSQGNAEEK